MRRWVIGRRIKLEYNADDNNRCWLVNGWLHRYDDGPAFENTKNGYCQFWA